MKIETIYAFTKSCSGRGCSKALAARDTRRQTTIACSGTAENADSGEMFVPHDRALPIYLQENCNAARRIVARKVESFTEADGRLGPFDFKIIKKILYNDFRFGVAIKIARIPYRDSGYFIAVLVSPNG